MVGWLRLVVLVSPGNLNEGDWHLDIYLKKISKLVHDQPPQKLSPSTKKRKQTSSPEVFSAKSETWTRRLWNSMASDRPKDQSLCRRKGDRQIESLLAGCKEVRDTDGD